MANVSKSGAARTRMRSKLYSSTIRVTRRVAIMTWATAPGKLRFGMKIRYL